MVYYSNECEIILFVRNSPSVYFIHYSSEDHILKMDVELILCVVMNQTKLCIVD
jgi:hypothetical protein